MSSKEKTMGMIRNELSSLYEEVKRDYLLYSLILIVVLMVSTFSYAYGYTNRLRFFSYLYVLKFIIPISIVLYMIFYYFKLLINREPAPLRQFKNKITLVYIHRTKLLSSFVLMSAMSLFMSSFSMMKSMIPIVNMFKFDLLFQELDKWLFLGSSPALLIHSFIDSPYVFFIINFCYNLWFFLMWTVLCYFLLASHSVTRTRFFISWLLCWSILGIVLAMLLSSAGPVFVPRLTPGNHTYDLLIQALENKNDWLITHGWPGLFSLDMQDILWDAYVNNKELLGSGISAMPSLHVSIAVLLALSVSSVNKKIGYAFWVFAFVIFIGSFTLGWHYFVDGIVSAPLTFLIWHMSSYLCKTERYWCETTLVK